ncbi:MAG: YwbE family protein [Firmicutes bacterium]|nr:YwbE family protein [Bacillota bacterium]MBU4553609.1 YwbE family protein [Bacillota bacterium]MBV1728593.1 YwbE family protein [Desulforudis sp.]MBV1735109.1 YwbE family protein [Desulforudis sp.]MBV1770085.1 YwbE family protein [Desulforudis sp.]
MDGTARKNIQPGLRVRVVQKQHQRTGQLTEGVVKDILTKSPAHPHGIKVRLDNGIVGRVRDVLDYRDSHRLTPSSLLSPDALPETGQ